MANSGSSVIGLNIEFTRRFNNEKFAFSFSSECLGTCTAVKTDEGEALRRALDLLKLRLDEVIAADNDRLLPPSSWMAL